jgi:hypothetical protein
MGSDERAIREVHATWIYAVNGGDLVRLLALINSRENRICSTPIKFGPGIRGPGGPFAVIPRSNFPCGHRYRVELYPHVAGFSSGIPKRVKRLLPVLPSLPQLA